MKKVSNVIALTALFFGWSLCARAEDCGDYVEIFSPFTTESASISPDGRHIAYSLIESDMLYIVTVSIDAPGPLIAKVAISSRKAMRGNIYMRNPSFEEDYPFNIVYLGWVSQRRVVVMTRLGNEYGIMAFDVDGQNARVLGSSRTPATGGQFKFLGRSDKADCVVLRTSVRMANARVESYDYLRLDTVTGKFKSIGEKQANLEIGNRESAEKANRSGWNILALEARDLFPNKYVTILENDMGANRYLVVVEDMSDPGSFYVIDRQQKKAFDMVRRSPRLTGSSPPVITQFDFVAAGGKIIKGELCMPRASKVKHPPVVVLMPEKLNRNFSKSFSRESLAFSSMGLATVRFDSFVPGAPPEGPALNSIYVDQVAAMLDALFQLDSVSKKRVVLYGERSAGYYALKALQLRPDRFVGAIVIEPSLNNWDKDNEQAKDAGRLASGTDITRPIFALASGNIQMSAGSMHITLQKLVQEANRLGAPSELVEQTLDFRAKRPVARSLGFGKICHFVNMVVYSYVVKLGGMDVIE